MVEKVSNFNREIPGELERKLKVGKLFAIGELIGLLVFANCEFQKNYHNETNYPEQAHSTITVQDGTLAVNNYHNQLPVYTISAAQDSVPPDTIEYKEGY